MKILVAVKRVIDPYVTVRVKADNRGVETQHVKMSLNPFDEIAVEEALRFKEKQLASEVIAVTVGCEACQETLRHALALGVDRAILVQTDDMLCSLSIAKILHNVVVSERPDLVLMGKQSIDGDNNQTPQMLAALLGWPQATYASKIVAENKETLHITREIDGGLETLAVTLPAVVSTDLRLNEPRYASLPNIMKAKQKPLQKIALASLGVALKQHVQIERVVSPAVRRSGIKVDSVTTLLEKLRHEAKVL